jgi:5-amino-6-(5-phosphoribosylamino)uracil reductase
MRERPYVLLSAAMSADGYIDDASASRLVLSDDADLERVDELRAHSDAILVGAQTIRTDNPSLQVRSADRRRQRTERGLAPGPRKVTITRSGDLDPRARFFGPVPHTPLTDSPLADSPLVYAAPAIAGDLSTRLSAAAVVVPVPAAAGGAAEEWGAGTRPGNTDLDLIWILADLAARGVGQLMVEGGARVLGQFLSEGLADEFQLAVAPFFVADPAAPRLVEGMRPGDRMSLAGVTQAGDMAVLRFLPRTGGRG